MKTCCAQSTTCHIAPTTERVFGGRTIVQYRTEVARGQETNLLGASEIVRTTRLIGVIASSFGAVLAGGMCLWCALLGSESTKSFEWKVLCNDDHVEVVQFHVWRSGCQLRRYASFETKRTVSTRHWRSWAWTMVLLGPLPGHGDLPRKASHRSHLITCVTLRFRVLLGLFFLALVYPLGVFVCGPLRRWQRRRRGLCQACGYSLQGNVSCVCPECGTAV